MTRAARASRPSGTHSWRRAAGSHRLDTAPDSRGDRDSRSSRSAWPHRRSRRDRTHAGDLHRQRLAQNHMCLGAPIPARVSSIRNGATALYRPCASTHPVCCANHAETSAITLMGPVHLFTIDTWPALLSGVICWRAPTGTTCPEPTSCSSPASHYCASRLSRFGWMRIVSRIKYVARSAPLTEELPPSSATLPLRRANNRKQWRPT